jgi:hypothetical protein
LDIRISPIETGEQSPRGVKNLLANSAHPLGERRDFARFIPTARVLQVSKYCSTTLRCRADESSPTTA